MEYKCGKHIKSFSSSETYQNRLLYEFYKPHCSFFFVLFLFNKHETDLDKKISYIFIKCG